MAVITDNGIPILSIIFCVIIIFNISLHWKHAGRFDLNLSIFYCNNCNHEGEAQIEDYIRSGWWPGSPNLAKLSYLFSMNLLDFWFNLMHKSPGTSERKFLEILGEMSEKSNRVSVIF